ncbi:MAG: thioesterase family protein [Chloroflexota bacterium]
MVTLEQLSTLPIYYRKTVPHEYLDEMGHMNVRWYMAIFDDAAYPFFASFGMHIDYYKQEKAGGFALRQFVNYLAEVRVGETVVVRTRLLGRSAKRIHFMHFLINETKGKLAATMEGLGSHADLTIRRTSPYPPHIAAQIDVILDEQSKLDWDAPVCGVIKP